MTEEKKSPNPFINMANKAKKTQDTKPKHNIPKPSKNFKNNTVVRRSGRGG